MLDREKTLAAPSSSWPSQAGSRAQEDAVAGGGVLHVVDGQDHMVEAEDHLR